MPTIVLSGQTTATTADILNSTRLQSAPGNGSMTIQLQSSAAVEGTNAAHLTLQLPSGQNPAESVLVPADAGGSSGVLNSREWLSFTFPISQGGHVVFGLTETGTAVVTWRVIYKGPVPV